MLFAAPKGSRETKPGPVRGKRKKNEKPFTLLYRRNIKLGPSLRYHHVDAWTSRVVEAVPSDNPQLVSETKHRIAAVPTLSPMSHGSATEPPGMAEGLSRSAPRLSAPVHCITHSKDKLCDSKAFFLYPCNLVIPINCSFSRYFSGLLGFLTHLQRSPLIFMDLFTDFSQLVRRISIMRHPIRTCGNSVFIPSGLPGEVPPCSTDFAAILNLPVLFFGALILHRTYSAIPGTPLKRLFKFF